MQFAAHAANTRKYDENGTTLWATDGAAATAITDNKLFTPASYGYQYNRLAPGPYPLQIHAGKTVQTIKIRRKQW